MLLIGLTGSIATGKSTVSSLLSSPPYNLPIIDADLLARKVVEPGTAGYNAIVSYFGPTTPDLLLPSGPDMPENGPNGKGRPLNRPALGRRVFGDSPEVRKDRARLNSIVHPAVRKEMALAVLKAYVKGYRAVVLDVPLLFESQLDKYCGTVLVVGVKDPQIQMERLRARDPHLSAEDAENRVRSQGDVREKAERALERGDGRGVVVWNDGERRELEEQVREVFWKGVVEKQSPRWWGWWLWMCPPAAVVSALWNYWANLGVDRRWREKKEAERAKLLAYYVIRPKPALHLPILPVSGEPLHVPLSGEKCENLVKEIASLRAGFAELDAALARKKREHEAALKEQGRQRQKAEEEALKPSCHAEVETPREQWPLPPTPALTSATAMVGVSAGRPHVPITMRQRSAWAQVTMAARRCVPRRMTVPSH
ncbi:dephospho-CoA kinase-domain-containing protein [Copromyces sp. CBS 386.78]|nr:dephospho-CoA kinase-domain-containing protein [Copromyces sp. CBS 386.78]